jgi:hypothetical protein
MIQHGTFNQILKTGLYFAVESGADHVYTGDLFYDMKLREFQIRGVPALGTFKRHVFSHDFKGPVSLHLVVKRIREEALREGTHYIDLRFLQAKCIGEFAASLEEHFETAVALPAIEANWEIVGDLTWWK